jgi:hypothetical protein
MDWHKDFSKIPEDVDVAVGCYVERHGDLQWETWTVHHDDFRDFSDSTATHWTPLPKAPHKPGTINWSGGLGYTDEGGVYIVGTDDTSTYWEWGYEADAEKWSWEPVMSPDRCDTEEVAYAAVEADYKERKNAK